MQAPVFSVDASQGTAKIFWNKEFEGVSMGALIDLRTANHAVLVGRPAARVVQHADRSALYQAARELVRRAQRIVYDTSWGLTPVDPDIPEQLAFRDGYREEIFRICRDRDVTYREIVSVGSRAREDLAMSLTARLASIGRAEVFSPRFIELPAQLPMLEFIVVDSQEMIISGLGAEQREFLQITGGGLPALLSDYLERVWVLGRRAPARTEDV